MTHRSRIAERFSCRLTQLTDHGNPAEQVVTILTGHGLRRADAQRLVTNELSITPITGIRKLTELLEGRFGVGGEWIEASEASKVAGANLVAFLLWDGTSSPQPESFTEEERSMVVEHGLDVAVQEGFCERVANYVASQDQLAAVLKLFAPTVGCGERTPDKTRRLIAVAAELLGAEVDWADTK